MPKEDGDEAEKEEYFKWLEEFEKNIRTLHRIHWHRIVLDEGQHIKTPGSRTSKACRKLHGTFRWAVSGTPVQNSMEEVYSYLDFLRVPNTLDLADFKKEYAEKEGIEKLSQLLSSFLIRRTYKSTILNKPVVELPDSIRRVVGVEMSEHEYRCYKNVEDWAKKYIAKKIKEIKGLDPLKDKLEIDRRWKQILMVILRLRQLVSSPLIGSHFYALFDNAGHLEHVVEECSIYALKIPEIRASADILRKICARAKAQLKRVVQARKDDAVSDDELYKAYFLGMGPYQSVAERKKEKLDKPYSEIEKFSSKSDRLRFLQISADPSAVKKFMKGEGQLFASAKMREVLKQLAKWLRADPTGKIIIFAQFLESLKILGFLCNYYDWQTRSYTGSMTPKSRSKAREQWASDPEIPILLASLKCGGEGLNLIEGNKVIILDLWFNEAAEQQAFGRCYRIGQEKPTELVRIAAVGTVDFRLLQIQKRKNQQIAALMSDTKNSSASWSVRDYMELIGLTEEDFEDVPGEPWFGGNIREPRFPHPDQFQADMTTKEFAEVIDDSEVDQEEDGSEDPNDLSLFVRGNTSSVKHVRFPSSPDLLATGKVAFDSTEDQFLHDTAASDGKQSTHANSVSADDDDKPNDQLDDADFVDVEKFLQDVYEKEAMRHKDTSAASPPEVVDLSVADAGVSGYDNMMSGTDTDLTVRDAAVDSASTPTEQASPRSLSGSAKTTALPLRFASLYHGMSIEPQTGIGQKGAQDKTKMGLDAKTGIQIKDEPDSDVEITASWTKHRSQSQSHGCIDLTVAGDDFEIIDLPKPKIKSEIVDLTEL